MNGWVVVLAMTMAAGVSLISTSLPMFRKPKLAQRVTPYLGLAGRPSRLLTQPESSTPWPTVERLVRPVVTDGVRSLDRALGGSTSVRARLDRLGPEYSVEQFRYQQLVFGVSGAGLALVSLGLRSMKEGLPPIVPSMLLVVLAFGAGVLLRDRMLSTAVARRLSRMRTEFPTIVELLTLAVGAGEGLTAALERASGVGHGAFVQELRRCLTDMRAGSGTVDALHHLSGRVDLPEVRRFVDALVVAIERGTPLVDVLQAQAVDAREAGRRALIEAGGRKEIAMMVPVVFLVLPLSVVFALFPGFYGLSLGSS